MTGTLRITTMCLWVFLFVFAHSFAASPGTVKAPVDAWRGFEPATDEELETLFSAPLPEEYSYALPDAVHSPFQSPYPPSPVPDAKEFATIQRAAEDGDPEAQLHMGHFYVNGDAVDRDLATGAEWYGKAAERGNARAQYYLGFLYECGAGVPRDYAEAFRWYLKAVDQDDPAAHLAIAGFHFAFRKQYMPMYFGRYVNWRAKAAYLTGGPWPERPSLEECIWAKYHSGSRFYQNDIVLANFLREKAITGDFEATLNLAKMVFNAQSVSRDRGLCSQLILASAGQGSDAAAYILGAVPEMGKYYSSSPYPFEKAEKEKEAFLAVAARRNWNPLFVYTIHSLALLKDWDVHRGMSPEAMRLHWHGLRKMADQGYAPAQFEVAERIIKNGGAPEAAADLLEKASAAGYMRAKGRTGIRKLLGIGIRQDIDAGKRLLDEACFSSAADNISLPEEFFVGQAQFKNIQVSEFVLNRNREAGDAASLMYLGSLNEVTSRGEKPLDLYLEAFDKEVWPAVMVIKDYVRLKSGKPGFGHHMKPGESVDPRAVMLDNPRYFARNIALPAAEAGYGPAILIVLADLAENAEFLPADTELAEYWLDKYFSHKDWYAIRLSWFSSYKVIDKVYGAVCGGGFPYSLQDGSGFFSHGVGFD